MGLSNSQHEIDLLQVRRRRSSFTSVHPASEIIAKMEETAKPLGFNVKKQDFKVRATFALSFFTIVLCIIALWNYIYSHMCPSVFLLPAATTPSRMQACEHILFKNIG